jgi:Na+-transporting methylmalonyl-CoA/oxaloacetate decarboxylase gamma subunit
MGNLVEILLDILWVAIVLFIMVFICFFTSGIANIPGSLFERKSTPEERAAAEVAKKAEERGTVRGGREQAV